MKSKVIIEMKSVQLVGGEKSEAKLITEGTYEEKNDCQIISYKDSEATGFEGSVTDITIKEEKYASIVRQGSSRSDLMIEPGKKHHCHYGTPYGEMVVGIYTHKIENKLDGMCGSIYMKYTIDINSSYMSDNEIILNIRPA